MSEQTGSWLQITFVVDAAQVEPLSSLLEVFLAQAVTTENAGADEFYEVAFPGTPDWQKVAVTGLFDGAVEAQPIVEFIHQQITIKDQEIPTKIERLAEQNWERVWLDQFKPIQVGKALWVCPSWCEPVAPNERNIILDPGLAFGTGTHPTTHLCLSWLAEQNLHGQRVLDYGSGSGILAIAALMSGATHADAVDIDPLAVEAAKENAARNQVVNQLSAWLPDQLPAQTYPLVIANILAEVIIEIRTTLLSSLASGGTLILTGILDTQVQKVIDAYGDDFSFEVEQQEQWSMLIGQTTQQFDDGAA